MHTHPSRKTGQPVSPDLKGFTLTELLVCLSVIAIITLVAVPPMRALSKRSRATSTTNALITHLHLTRSTAITRRVTTVMCPTTDGAACSDSTDWGSGWLVFLDRSGTGRPDATADIVRAQQQPISASMQLSSTAGRTRIRYLPDGRSAGSNLTLSLCDDQGALLSRVIVNNTGRVRSERASASARCRG